MPWQQLCFGYSAFIHVKRNFEQTNLFEVSLLYFNWKSIEKLVSLALHLFFASNIQISESLHREVIFKHDS